MIRAAVEADIPAIVEMGARFHVEANLGHLAEYVPADTAVTVQNLITNDWGILLVAESDGLLVGLIGGVMTPLFFNHSHGTGQEMFWWVNPEYRGTGLRLLIALEQAAKDAGCQSWTMGALDAVNPEAVGQLYKRRGYRPSDHNWIRSL